MKAHGLEERLAALPAAAGVYLMKGARGRVLYVGKAANLRTRVRSYWNAGAGDRVLIPKLAPRVEDISVLATANVKDALLLENELIKQYKPPFNLQLRDDKQYQGLRLDKNAPWPRLHKVRRFKKDGALYFGPYTRGMDLRRVLAQLQKIFPLRTCSDGVFRDYKRRGRPCIEYEMKRCPAPCVDLIDKADYDKLVQGVELFLRGRTGDLAAKLTARMKQAAAEQNFEEAAELRDRREALLATLERQQIVSGAEVNRDVFGLARRGGELVIQVLHVREGRVIGASDHAFSRVEIDDAAALSSFLGQYYVGGAERQLPGELLLSVDPADEGALAVLLSERADARVLLRAPSRGPARELVALAERNAELTLTQKIEARASIEGALEELKQRLALTRMPRRIECYDVSHLSGTLAVASRVVFDAGLPHKQGYRRYRIRDAAAGDDLACMREVLGRRLARREEEPLPDLIMLDGGRGQLGVADALLRDAGIELDRIGLAKQRDEESAAPRVKRGGGLKAERVFLPGRKNPVLLPSSSRALLLLQRVRDEAHRFAITFQRELRRRVSLTSILEEIPGIGPQKRRALLRTFGSLKRVREADAEALTAAPGISAADAEAIRDFFQALADVSS